MLGHKEIQRTNEMYNRLEPTISSRSCSSMIIRVWYTQIPLYASTVHQVSLFHHKAHTVCGILYVPDNIGHTRIYVIVDYIRPNLVSGFWSIEKYYILKIFGSAAIYIGRSSDPSSYSFQPDVIWNVSK